MKYKVTISTLFHEGKRYVRGDIIETDVDYGTRVEPYVEPEKPKRKRKAKVEHNGVDVTDLAELMDSIPSTSGIKDAGKADEEE